MHSNIRFIVLVTTAACAALPAFGQSQTFKFGVIRYDAHSRTNGVTGIGVPAGADAEVGDATTVLFTYEYEVKPQVGIELVLGVPPKIKARATGSVAFLGDILSARNVAPAMIVNYHFGESGAALRPYLGLGISYTHFVDIKTPYGWDVKLTDSVGPVLQAGLDYAITPRWGLFGSIARVDVKSKLVATGATVLQSTIDFRPWTYSLGAAYRF